MELKKSLKTSLNVNFEYKLLDAIDLYESGCLFAVINKKTALIKMIVPFP